MCTPWLVSMRLVAAAVLLKLTAVCADRSDALFESPRTTADHAEWLQRIRSWADSVRNSIDYNGSLYLDRAVNWTRVSYVQPQTFVYDRFLYDPSTGEYTVDRYLDDVNKRYGGIDSILLWPTYTNIGIDDRNQFDLFRATPGGLPALKNLTAQFKERGIRVLWPFNPWDQGTRKEEGGEATWTTMAKTLKYLDADGFNGDTMHVFYKVFWEAGIKAGHPLVGEMEHGYPESPSTGNLNDTSWESANWDTVSWAEEWQIGKKNFSVDYDYPLVPGVDKWKLIDSRHLVHVCARWAKNRTDPLQYAFFNGDGFESWENVWGVFMKFTERDGEALRRVATLLRWLGRREFIQGVAEIEPFTPDLSREAELPYSAGGLMASKFVRKDGSCVYLIVNRAAVRNLATLKLSCYGDGRAAYDLYHGVELKEVGLVGGAAATVVDIEAHGYGAVLVSRPSHGVTALLSEMRAMTKVPLSALSTAWAPLQQHMVGMEDAKSWQLGGSAHPPGMIYVPRSKFRFRTAGVEVEGGCDSTRDTWGVCCSGPQHFCPGDAGCGEPCSFAGEDSRGVDVQFPWEKQAGRFHDKEIEVGPFYIDTHLVTRADYARYLEASKYVPREAFNFLPSWGVSSRGTRVPPAGTERWPVTSISLAEARAYCAWAGKRLPHVYEWQLAAQGTDGRLYPWGNSSQGAAGFRYPRPSNASLVPPLHDVGSFSPQGDSLYGMADAIGHVWQYTDEFQDEHTRTVILKGSSLYTPMLSGSFPALPQKGNWYFPKALQLDRHNRMMLMDDTYERVSTLGFRCLADVEGGQAAPHHYRDVDDDYVFAYV
eukprot:TRINITY_DN100828_c0_g1_i1.p1 TRINITY_DN100828_c0_g1~~TRINITY_DN100828_c0_g1_i1.p1  ORF type:complete len:852 (+),score=98.52 TRINITY_DN100828_c0_g1_i1:93-2558(+)